MSLRGILVLPLLLLTGLALPAAAQAGNWTAEYFNNPSLAGQPVVVRSEASPRGNWGPGAPHAGVPADFFSVRWTTNVPLAGGSWQLSAQADDGVRVLVDGALVIDEWRVTGGDLFQQELELPAGSHRVVVEYLEQEGAAHVIFNMDPLLPPPAPGEPRARITARFLNMRDQPGIHGAVVEIVSLNQVLPVVGRNGDGSWLELGFGELEAWVNARHAEAENLGAVPVTDGRAAPGVGVRATVTASVLNLRILPDSQRGTRLLRIREGERYPVLGRTLDEQWLWLNVKGVTGWANSEWLAVQPGLRTVPVLHSDAVLSSATVRANYLNLRAGPSRDAQILQLIGGGEIYAVLGRSSDAGWVQLNVGGAVGWVSSDWVLVLPSLVRVPVIDGGGPGDAAPPASEPEQPLPTVVPEPEAHGTATVEANYLNLRSAPDAGVLRVVTEGSRYPALGRSADSRWVQLSVAGQTGWVSSDWVTVTPALATLPVTG